MNNISQRDAFWKRVTELARDDKNIIIISADMGAPSLDIVRKDMSSQFVNVGIAEQNAITIASGLVLSGKKVFVYAIAPFITIRCLEQIRVECAIMNIPITIVGVGAGFGYEDSGPTHHIIEDIAMLRSMPNIQINNITDTVMASAFADISVKEKVTNYVRLHRQSLPVIYNDKHNFTEGLAVLKRNKDFYIISTGCMTHTALDIASNLAKKKIDIGVIDAYTIPLNEKLLLDTVKGVKKIISLEELFLPGGLGSAICEILMDNDVATPVKRIGLPIDKGYCYKYGGQEIIRSYYGIDKENTEKKIISFLNKK